jgi:hypothetical protein
VGSKNTIDYNFDYLNVDNNKSGIKQYVHDSGNGTHHHFVLSNRYKGHQFPSFATVIVPIYFFAQQYVAPYFRCVFIKQVTTAEEKYSKNDT